MIYKTRVAIIGAGPAGSIASYILSRANIDNLLIDKKEFPRDKTCGDLITSDGTNLLKEVGLYDKVRQQAHQHSALEVIVPNGKVIKLHVDFLTCPRKIFDYILVRSAQETGSQLLEGTRITNPVYNGIPEIKYIRGVTKNKEEIKVFAEIYLLATGADTDSLRKFSVLEEQGLFAIATRKYIQKRDITEDKILLSYEKSTMPGYGWIYPIGNEILNVGCGVIGNIKKYNLKKIFKGFITDSKKIHELLKGSEEISKLKGAMLRVGFRGSKLTCGNLMVVGESLGLSLPLIGEGIGKSMESGREAANVIVEDFNNDEISELTFKKYQTRLEKKYRKVYNAYHKAQRIIKHPMIVNFLARRANKNKEIKHDLEMILKEEVDPTHLLSIKGFLRYI